MDERSLETAKSVDNSCDEPVTGVCTEMNQETGSRKRNFSGNDFVSNTTRINLSKDVDDETAVSENRARECSPIILNVRGNVTDMECLTETSTINKSTSKVPVSAGVIAVVSNQNSKTTDGLLHHSRGGCVVPHAERMECEGSATSETSTTNITDKGQCDTTSQEENNDMHNTISTLTFSLTNNDTSSTTDENSIVRVTSNVTLPATSIMLSMMSKVTTLPETQSLPNLKNVSSMPETSDHNISGLTTLTVGTPVALKRSVSEMISNNSDPINILTTGQTSTPALSRPTDVALSRPINIAVISNGASQSSTLSNHQKIVVTRTMVKDMNNRPLVYTTTPSSKGVKIVLKAPAQNLLVSKRIPATSKSSLNSSSHNDNLGNSNSRSSTSDVDSESYCRSRSIIERIFSYISVQNGMNRTEVFDTDLLKPLRKVREDRTKQFVCSVCGDEFHFEEFLNHHLDRKVFELNYFCMVCKKDIMFYNKCKFWLHLKQESHQGIDWEILKKGTSYFNLKPFVRFDRPDLSCVPQKRCKFCNEVFFTNDAYINHFKNCGASQYFHKCNMCGMSFFTKCALLAHLTIHEAEVKDVVCPECGETLTHSDGLKLVFDHLDACNHFNSGYMVTCRCKKSFTSEATITHHLLKSHTKLLLRCNHCLSCFSSLDRLGLHCKTVHNTSPIVSKVVLCTLCNQGFQNPFKLKSHIINHSNAAAAGRKRVLLCFICNQSFLCPNTLNNHVEKEHTHRPKRCTICFALFESRQKIVQHIVSKSCTPGKLPTKLHVCMDMPACGDELPDINIYKQHFGISQESILRPCELVKSAPVPPKTPNSTEKAVRLCESVRAGQAPSKTKTPEKVVQHVTDKKKMQCHPCKISLVGSHHYGKHMALHRSNGFVRSQTECCICKKTVADTLIQSHMEDHQKRGIIVCSLCHSRNFDTMHDALKHSKNLCFYEEVENDGASYIKSNVSSNVNENFESYDLTTVEGDGSEMEISNDKNSQEDSSVFPCLMCGLAFTSKQAKEDHVSRIHDGTRIVYLCLVCKRRGARKYFTKKSLINKHISHKHRIVNPAVIASMIHEEEQNVTSGLVVPTEQTGQSSEAVSPPKRLRFASEGDFMCGKCGFSSEDSKLFEDHIATHNSKKEPQCPECGLCFTVLAALKKHLFVVHKIKAMDEYLIKKGMAEPEEEEEEEEPRIDVINVENDVSVLMYDSSEEGNESAPKKVVKSSSDKRFECNVCYKIFSSEIVLKSHLRNHGMAFIRSRRHDKAPV